MAKEESTGSVSQESIDFLHDVKKGKPRRFAMICKGVSIISLVVYKKGSIEKHKKEAKETGKGQFYFGIIDGSGQNLRFVLSREEGFDSAPVKATVLKSFLDEEAGLKCKPTFEIVDAAVPILDDDDPLVARFLALRDKARTECDSHPDRAAEINALCQSIESHLGKSDIDQATTGIENLEKLLAELAALKTAQATTSTPKPESTAPVASADQQTAALNKMLPTIKAILAEHPELKEEVLRPVANFKALLSSGDLVGAKSTLLQLGSLLKSLKSGTANPEGSTSNGGDVVSEDVLAIWREAKDEVDTQLNKLVAAMHRSPHPYLRRVAEVGLHGITIDPSRIFVTMQASLFDFARASGELRAQAATRVREAAKNYRQFVTASKVLEVCDTKSICGPLTLRKTLLDALSQVERIVSVA